MAEEVSETSRELSLVCPSDIVYSDPGRDAVLSCRLEPAISAAQMEIKWWKKEDLVCHYRDGQMIESCEGRVSLSLEDLHNGNVSLTLKNIRRSQRGHYICEVIHECKTINKYVFLHISSEDFSLVVPPAPVFANPGSDIILPAHLSPETSAVSMEIRWSRGAKLIYQYNNGQENTNTEYESRVSLSIRELENGKLALTLRNVQQTDSGDYTCKVFHDGCQQTGLIHLQVRGSAPKRRRRNSMDEDRPLMSNDGKQKRQKRMIPVEPEELCFVPKRRSSMDEDRPLIVVEPEGSEAVHGWESPPSLEHLPKEEKSELIISLLANWTQIQENPGATSSQQQENISTEQEISTPDTQSQVQERERPSESLTAGDTTQTPERAEEK